MADATFWVRAAAGAAVVMVYFIDRRGTTYVMAAEPVFKVSAVNRLENDRGPFNASPAIGRDDSILLRSDRSLYRITGE